MKRFAGITGAVTVLAALVFMALVTTPPARLIDAQALRQKASQYDARIVRDDLGVPHVSGHSDADAAFGLGYAHAEDDWKTIEGLILAARGTLARHQGFAAVKTDYLVRLFRIRDLVDARYEKDLDAQTRAMLEGYAAGLNLYALDHMHKVRPGVLPVTAKDVVAGFVLRAPFFYGLQDDLAALFAPPAKKVSLGDADHAFLASTAPQPHFGSNAFAVAPGRSTDGATRLVINSHQPYSGPVAWYEAQVTSDEGWNMAGGIFPGSPVILHGFNANLGWAHTVNKPDLVDIYALKINPEDPDEYWFDGAWRRFEMTKAHLRIHLWGPFSVLVPREVLWAVQGPALRTPRGVFAMRFSGLYDIRAVQQWYRMNKAYNFVQWRAAMAMNAIPSLNVVYGDRAGNIGYFYNALMPRRGGGFDWRKILPGDDPRALWTGFMPPSSLPMVVNPASGFVFNANNTPFRASAASDDADPANYSLRFGIEHYMTNRGRRLLALLNTKTPLGYEDVKRIKFDLAYAQDSEVARLMRDIASLDTGKDPVLAQAQALLGKWDLRTDRDNRAAALGVLVVIKCIGLNADGDPWLMDPKTALKRSAQDLLAHHGRLDIPWGQVSRFRRGKVDMPIDGGPDVLRAVYSAGHDLEADGTLTAVAGDTWIAIVTWDHDGVLHARTRHQFGSATLDRASPHYDDQARPFVHENLRDFPFTPQALATHTERTYRVGGR